MECLTERLGPDGFHYVVPVILDQLDTLGLEPNDVYILDEIDEEWDDDA